MPWIIDYQNVLERLTADGLTCNYYNGGAFGYAPEQGAAIRGWIGSIDSTIKPGVRSLTRNVPPPYEQTLAALLMESWQKYLPGNVWVLPASHWAYELNHSSRDWMPSLIENIDLDPGLLATRNNAAAIEFAPDEADSFRHFTGRLLDMLQGSDFTIAFPRRLAICTLHHHKQLWWVSPDESVIESLDQLVAGRAAPSL